jgi:hypothetical protein
MRHLFDEAGEAYVGTAQEIRALYGSMKRAMKVQHTNYMPLYSDMPRFNKDKQYSLFIDEKGFYAVYPSEMEEPINKGALRRFICQEAIKRCRMFREDGYWWIGALSSRSVCINDTIDVPFKEFLDSLRYTQTVGAKIGIHVGNLRVWVKPTDDIEVM